MGHLGSWAISIIMTVSTTRRCALCSSSMKNSIVTSESLPRKNVNFKRFEKNVSQNLPKNRHECFPDWSYSPIDTAHSYRPKTELQQMTVTDRKPDEIDIFIVDNS